MKYVVLKNIIILNHERNIKLKNPKALEKERPTRLESVKNTDFIIGK